MVVRNSEIVFRDLQVALEELHSVCESPVNVRRKFRSFILLTQNLTEIMRKEFSDITGQKWDAASFSGWNAVTELFKKLRKTDYHESPVRILIKEESKTSIRHLFPEVPEGQLMCFETVWDLGDPFEEDISNGLALLAANGVTRLPIDQRSYRYLLHPCSNDLSQAIAEAGSDDIQTLSAQCMHVLTEYYAYYCKRLNDSDQTTKR